MHGQGRLDIRPWRYVDIRPWLHVDVRPWLLMYVALVALVIVFHATGARGG